VIPSKKAERRIARRRTSCTREVTDMFDTRASLVSRSVVCPRCRADAVISYPRAELHPDERQHDIVYLCPNLCALQPHQAAALIPGRHT
jgi:hypothetical protein